MSSVDLSMRSTRVIPETRRGPLLVYLAIAAICIPINIQAGPIALNPLRLLLLVAVIPLFFQLVTGKYGRILLIDILMIGHVFWQFVAVGVNNPSNAIQFAGSNGLEFLGGYLVARCGIRNYDDFVAFVKFLFLAILFSLPFAMVETQTGRAILPNFMSSLGFNGLRDVQSEPRLGLHRAQVFMVHPIHYGLFCSMALSLVFVGLTHQLSLAKRVVMAALICTGTVMSVSSGALLPLVIQTCLIGWAAATRKIEKRWWLLLIVMTPVYMVLEVLSDRPAYLAILTSIAFNAHNVYWRTIIFEWGAQNVMDNPIFGLGLRDWVRPGYMRSASVDNFWLLNAMRFGFPGFFLLVGGILLAMARIMARPFGPNHPLGHVRLAWVLLMIALIFGLTTVHVWGPIYSLVMLMFGSGIWLITAPAETDDPAESGEETIPEPAFTRYSRFPIRQGAAARARRGVTAAPASHGRHVSPAGSRPSARADP